MSKKAAIIPVLTLLAAALIFLTIKQRWVQWQGGGARVETDDAYLRADVTPLSTRISGTVHTVAVNDFESVHAGQLLMQLDDDDYKAALGEAQAALAGAQASFADNQAAKKVEDAKVLNAQAQIDVAASAIDAAKAGVAAIQAEVLRTEQENKRQEALLAAQATTRQEQEQAVAAAGQYAGTLSSRQADLKRAEASLASSRSLLAAERSQREALDTRDAQYRAEIQAREAAIVVARVNLAYTRILAPTQGAVGERHVLAGQLVTPGVQLIDLVQGDIWVQANYKETQLTNMRSGDRAQVTIDTFPGLTLYGHVAEIAPASGSQFALLPPDNATGNFTRVVQRIPVKIVLDPDHGAIDRLRPGFSAVVVVFPSGTNSHRGAHTS